MPTPPRKLAKPQKSPTVTKRVRQPTTARPSKKPQRKLAIRPTDSAKRTLHFLYHWRLYGSLTAILGLLVCITNGCVNVTVDPKGMPDSLNLPAIKAARETKTKLQNDTQELNNMGKELDSITTNISMQHIVIPTGPADMVIKSLIESTRSLRESAKEIIDKAPRYIEKVDNFSATLNTAPETFTKAAQLFRCFAEQEPYKDVADDYRQVAILFENLATRTQSSQTSFRARYDRDALTETVKYIRHQERFLDRFEAALYTQGPELQELDAFLHQIENYSKNFEKLRTQIRELNTAFRGAGEQPKSPQPEKSHFPQPRPEKPKAWHPRPEKPNTPQPPPDKPKAPQPPPAANTARAKNVEQILASLRRYRMELEAEDRRKAADGRSAQLPASHSAPVTGQELQALPASVIAHFR